MTLAIVLSILGAYVLWRETQRDNAMIEMQAQFVLGISHELKTPLTAIRMFAETLQIADETGAGDPARRAEYIDTIVHESERLTRLLNNVLTFAQIERGNSSFHRQRIDLKEVLREAAHMMRFSLEDKELTLQLDLPDQVPSVKADRDAI
jgi:signal transduction histidine kinase